MQCQPVKMDENVNITSLTSFERNEISKYDLKNIYFTGEPNAAKLIPKDAEKISSCFDDEHGHYRLIQDDHIAYRYKVLNLLGKGTYGTVAKAVDYKTKKRVAIKVMVNSPYQNIADHEVAMNEYIASHKPAKDKHLVQFMDSFSFRHHKCIVSEHLYLDLSTALMLRDFQGYHMRKVRSLTRSILNGLRTLHRMNIVHGDVKLKNIVLRNPRTADVKLIDFGCSRFDESLVACGGIQTRNYMSPEVLLKLSYSKAIDIWGVGCCAYELLKGTKLFTSKDKGELLNQIITLIGLPSDQQFKEMMAGSAKPKKVSNSESQQTYTADQANSPPFFKPRQSYSRHMSTLIKNPRHKAYHEFLRRCLLWVPNQRLTVQQAMKHKWLKPK